MLVFGAGTLPAMLGLTVAAPALATFLGDRTVRRVIGFALLVLALWTVFMVWGASQGPTDHANQLSTDLHQDIRNKISRYRAYDLEYGRYSELGLGGH